MASTSSIKLLSNSKFSWRPCFDAVKDQPSFDGARFAATNKELHRKLGLPVVEVEIDRAEIPSEAYLEVLKDLKIKGPAH
jgi:hypothetical protein